MKTKKCLVLLVCLTLFVSIVAGCNDSSSTVTSGSKTITVNYLKQTAKFKNVTFYDHYSNKKVTLSGEVYFVSGFSAGTNEAVFIYDKKTYAAKIVISKDGSILKVYYSDTKYDTYKKK